MNEEVNLMDHFYGNEPRVGRRCWDQKSEIRGMANPKTQRYLHCRARAGAPMPGDLRCPAQHSAARS